MILIFDLDDTLYPEVNFALSGAEAVITAFSENTKWKNEKSRRFLRNQILCGGRQKMFDNWISAAGIHGVTVKDCVKVYRAHLPNLILPDETRSVLEKLTVASTFLVTDGNKRVQHRKIEALGIGKYFNRTYVTHDYGLIAAKPSLICFEKIRNQTLSEWEQLVYVGDDPSKDFVKLNKVGALTVRVMTGRHREAKAHQGFDAKIRVERLSQLSKAIPGIYD